MRFEKFRQFRKRHGIFLSAFALLFVPTSAQAQGFLLLSPQLSQIMLQSLGSGGQCISFTFDANGNRIAQSVNVIGSGATVWGAGTYGCFVWQ